MTTTDYFVGSPAIVPGDALLLVSDNQAYEQRLREALTSTGSLPVTRMPVAGGTPDATAVLRSVAANGAVVVAFGPDVELAGALACAEQLDAERPDTTVVIVAPLGEHAWTQALRAGVRDVVAPDASDAEVSAAFDRAAEAARRRRSSLSADPAGPRSRIVTVVSPKGGSGKTALTTNLAVAIAAKAPRQLAVLDLDLQFGDLSSAFGLVPEQTILGAASANGSLDAMSLKGFLTPHPDGFFVLCAPASPAEGEMVPAGRIGHVLELLAQEFPYVLVDTPAGITEHALASLEASTDVVLVCTMDVSSVRGLQKEIEALDQLGMTHLRRHFVLNRADARVGMDVEDVQATVGLPVCVEIPSSRSVPLSMNQGVALVTSEPRSPVARRFQQLAEMFVEDPASEDASGFLGKLRRTR